MLDTDSTSRSSCVSLSPSISAIGTLCGSFASSRASSIPNARMPVAEGPGDEIYVDEPIVHPVEAKRIEEALRSNL